MRLSEILKTTETFTTASSKLSPAPMKVPAVRPPADPAPETSPKVPSPQEISVMAEKIRREIQSQFEKEFQAKWNSAQEESKRLREEIIKAEEEKFFARAESFKKEKNQLVSQLEELRRQTQIQSEQGSTIAVLQKQISDMTLQLRARTETLSEDERRKAEKKLREEWDAAAHSRFQELERKIKERDKVIEDLRRPQSTGMVSTQTPHEEVSVWQKTPPVTPRMPSVPVFNMQSAREAQRFYNELVQHTRRIFDGFTQGQALELQTIQPLISKFVNLPHSQLDEFVGIVVEPYPEHDFFPYQAVNVMALCTLLGTDLRIEGAELEDLALAGLLYDISLLKIKDGLSYPKQLSEGLRNELKRHPQESVEVLKAFVSDRVQTAVLQHHELCNGRGYPSGLMEEAIHLHAKVLAVADTFEAMVHVRPYRQKAYEASEAVKTMVERERGLYDRNVMKALLNRVGLYPVKSYVELTNKQVARVLKQNRLFPVSPVIEVEFDEDGNKMNPSQIVDLSKNQLLHISGPLKTSQPYTTEKMAREKEKEESRNNLLMAVREIGPLLIIAVILAFFVYLVVKI